MTIGGMSDFHTEYGMVSCSKPQDVRLRGSIPITFDSLSKSEDIDLMIFGGDYTSQATYPQANWERAKELLVTGARGIFAPGKATPVLYAGGNHEYDAAGYESSSGKTTYTAKSYVCWDYYNTPMKQDIGLLDEENTSKDNVEANSFYEWYSENGEHRFKLLAAYYYQINGLDFVVLNTGFYLARSNANYYYSTNSERWVANKLAQLYAEDPDRTVFFICHFPFEDSKGITSDGSGSEKSKGMHQNVNTGFGVNSSKELKAALAKYPNTIMLYGHDHGTNAAFIRERTSQRITRYDVDGKPISAFDSTHVDGIVPGEDEPIVGPTSVTSGTFYLKNVGNGLYFGNNGSNVAMSEDPIEAKVELISGGLFKTTFEGKYNLSCGGEGLYSLKDRLSSTNAQENGYWFLVEDTTAAPIVARQVSALVPDGNYIVVQNYNGNFAIGNTVKKNSSGSLRLTSTSVTISDNTVSFANMAAARNYIYTLESIPVEKPVLKEGEYYLKNILTGTSLGVYNKAIGFSTQESDRQLLKIQQRDSKLHDFKISYYVASDDVRYLYLDEDKLGYVFKKTGLMNEQDCAYLYHVEDTAAETITATLAEGFSIGESYIIVNSYTKNSEKTYYALGKPKYKPASVTSGSFYLKNLGNGLYFGNSGSDVNMSETPVEASVSLIDGGLFKTAFEGKYNLSCGGEGLYSLKSDRMSKTNAQENGYWFLVSDTTATPIVATQVSQLVAGNNYIIVQNYQGNYALGNTVKKNSSGNLRLTSASVTISDNTVSFADINAARDYIYTLEATEEPTSGELVDGCVSAVVVTPVDSVITMDASSVKGCIYTVEEKYVEPEPEGDPSFVSCFLGSMRYYDNDAEGSWSSQTDAQRERTGKIIQALLIYVYDNRIEFQMKNFGESGTITDQNGKPTSLKINSELAKYTIYRKITLHNDHPTETAIKVVPQEAGNGDMYNVYGMKVDGNYHGMVIIDGQKFFKE